MSDGGLGALPAPVLPGSRSVSPEIDTIIRRARPKVCTRHCSPQDQDKQKDRSHDGASSAAPAVSNQRQGYLSASNTPKRLYDHKFNPLIRSGTKPGGEIAHSPSQKSTAPGLPVRLDASEALDDTLHVAQPFYHQPLFSPDPSETCSSWNLSPYPPLLDMTKPSTFLQASCSDTGTAKSPIGYSTPDASTSSKPATRHVQTSRLRQRIPHVSHFSVSQTAQMSNTSGNARNLQSSSQPYSWTTSNLRQQSNGSAGRHAHSKLHVGDISDRRSRNSSMKGVTAERAVTPPTAHQGYLHAALRSPGNDAPGEIDARGRIVYSERGMDRRTAQDIVMYRNAYACTNVSRSQSPSTSASPCSRTSPGIMQQQKLVSGRGPSPVDKTARIRMSEHHCNSGDQDALDVSLSTWSPAANGIGRRSTRGNNRVAGHTVPENVRIQPFKQSETGLSSEDASESPGGAASHGQRLTATGPCSSVQAAGGAESKAGSAEYFDCSRDIAVKDIRAHADAQDHRFRTVSDHSDFLDSPRELCASSPELQELEMELNRERAELEYMGASDSNVPAEDRACALDSMLDMGGARQADHNSRWHAQVMKVGRTSLLSRASGHSCHGSPVARAHIKSQPYAARFIQKPDFGHGTSASMCGMRDSVHVSSGGTSASLRAAFNPGSTAATITSPGQSPTSRCQPDIGYAGIDSMRRQVKQELRSPQSPSRPRSCPAATCTRTKAAASATPPPASISARPPFTVPQKCDVFVPDAPAASQHGYLSSSSPLSPRAGGGQTSRHHHASTKPLDRAVRMHAEASRSSKSQADTMPAAHHPSLLQLSQPEPSPSQFSSLTSPSKGGHATCVEEDTAMSRLADTQEGHALQDFTTHSRPGSKFEASQYSDASEAFSSRDEGQFDSPPQSAEAVKASDGGPREKNRPNQQSGERMIVSAGGERSPAIAAAGGVLPEAGPRQLHHDHKGSAKAQRDEPMEDSLKGETPSKVEALVHAIEELISQATNAGHDGITRSMSDNLGGSASLPGTPLRPSRSMPAVALDICDQHGQTSDEGCNDVGAERLTSAHPQSGGAVQPDLRGAPGLASQQCIAPTDEELGSSTGDKEARLGAANLISPTDGAGGHRSPNSDRFTDAANWPDPDQGSSACDLEHPGHSTAGLNLHRQHRHQELCDDMATGTAEVPRTDLVRANSSRCWDAATQLPPRVHFESIQLGQQVNDAIQRDHELSPWTQFGSFTRTCSFREGREASMSFLVSPPRWTPTAPPEDTAAAAWMLETAEHEQYTRHHDLAATRSPARPDGLSTSADSAHPRLITTATSAFSVTLPGQPAHTGDGVTFADADDGVAEVHLGPALPPASAGMVLVPGTTTTASPASSWGRTPSSEDSLDHYSGSSFFGNCGVSVHGSGTAGSPRARAHHSGASAHGRTGGNDGGQAIGEKANGPLGAEAAARPRRHRSLTRSPTRQRDTVELPLYQSALPGPPSPGHQHTNSIQSSPTQQLSPSTAAARSSTVDTATQVVGCDGPGAWKSEQAKHTGAGRDGSASQSHRVDSSIDTQQIGGTRGKQKPRAPLSLASLAPVLPFVGSPPPPERHMPQHRRSASHSMTHSTAYSSRTSSPTLTSRSPSPTVSSYAEAYVRSQATKRRLAAKEPPGAHTPVRRTPGDGDDAAAQKSSKQGVSGKHESPTRRMLRTLRSRSSAGTPAGRRARVSSVEHLQPGEAQRAADAQKMAEHSHSDAVDLSCWGGNAAASPTGWCALLDNICGMSPRHRHPRSPSGPLQRSVAEWRASCSQCGSPWQGAAAPATVVQRMQHAADGDTQHSCAGAGAAHCRPRSAEACGQPPGALAATSGRDRRRGGRVQRPAMCMSLDTLHSSVKGGSSRAGSGRRGQGGAAPVDSPVCNATATHSEYGRDSDDAKVRVPPASGESRRVHVHSAKKTGDVRACDTGSLDSGRIACGAPPPPESSTYAISTFETIDNGDGDDDDDDGQYCNTEEPVALNPRRWGRLFGCLRSGCTRSGLKSGDKVES